jgi:hypothetical protein
MYKATKEDIELSKRIIKEELNKCNKIISDDKCESIVTEVLNISYSIGGGYDEDTIRKIAQAYIRRNS